MTDVPRGTFMKIAAFFLIFTLVLVGCHQPNPHPEATDPIYSDLERSKKDLEGQLGQELKHLEEFEIALKAVKPQTGQIKYAQKRVYETREKVEKLKQLKAYYDLRLASRIESVKRSYAKAFEKNEPWPDPKEYEVYKSQKALEVAPRAWSVRDRIEKAAPPKKPAAGEHGAEHGDEHH